MRTVPEYVINTKIAEVLSEDLGVDARAERAEAGRRPDIRCYYKGLIVGIEASYNKKDAERDAKKRVEQGLADVVLALWLKTRFRDIPEPELKKRVKKARFDIKVFASRELAGTLIPYLKKKVKKAEPATGWFLDVDLPTIKAMLDMSADFITREKEIQELIKEIKKKVRDFTESLASLDRLGKVREKVYDVLYKLYGLSVAEAKDPEVAFGQAALSILLSVVFYEHIRSTSPKPMPSLARYTKKYGYMLGLRKPSAIWRKTTK